MYRRLWAKRRSILPVNVRFILVGMIGGLAMGATKLHESVDVASTAGFVMFFSLSVGLWLGMHLVIWMLSLAVAVTEGMANRVDALMARLGIVPERPAVSPTLANQLMRYNIVLTHAMVPTWAYALLYVLLGSQTTAVQTSYMPWAVCSLTALLLLGLAVQWGHIGILWRELISVEQRVNSMDMEILKPRVSADPYRRTKSAVERAHGIGVLVYG